MDPYFSFALGVVVAVTGYLLKRWWEGRADRDTLEETASLAAILKDIRVGNISLEALADLKRQLVQRGKQSWEGQKEIIQKIEGEIAIETQASAEYQPMSQQDMNRYAYHLADLAEQELKFLVDVLEGALSESELTAFRAAQKAWELYATEQAEFASLEFEGGTMQPMLRSSEYRALVIERAAQIKGEIVRRQEI